MSDRRLPSHPAQRVDRSRPLTFTFDGKSVAAYHGETVGTALCADGVQTLSRSFKYHRRRGLLCAAGRCPNCLMTVDGVPNVRACIAPVRSGAVVRSQHAWPSLETDVQGVLDSFDALLPVGFYYKTFMQPRWLWPTYEKVLRHLAGLGRFDSTLDPAAHSDVVHAHTDVAIVGGGPAGLSAALEAARLGAEVLLIDDQPRLGGHLQWHLLATDGTTPDYQRAEKLAQLVHADPRIRVLTDATAFGLYEGRLLAVIQRERMTRVRADRIVVASGGFEHPLVFQNNDLPGVFLGEGIQRVIALYGVRPGRRAVVVANDNRGLRVARELQAAGIELAAIADARVDSESALRSLGAPVALAGHTVVEAHGAKRVERVSLARLDAAGTPTKGSEQTVAADLLVLAAGWEPNTTLLGQETCTLEFRGELGTRFPTRLPEWLFVAGEVAGATTLDGILRNGKQAGLQAAVSIGLGDAADRTASTAPITGIDASGSVRPVTAAYSNNKEFVCLCEDVSTKDIKHALQEGFDHIQTLKRYTTITMGPCQGKMCHHTSVELCASMTAQTIATTGTTTTRPPATPVPLGLLAGPAHNLIRRTPCHHRHEESNATWMDMGAWKRPLVYSTIEAECRAVHERVGIIDVGTLGKLDVKGRDAAAYLEWIHPNRVANLKPGRIRYRVMLDDAGIILDDGTIARLADDHFFVTTGTGALEAVEQWLEWWLADGGRCVHVTNITAGLGAINVAGPRSRELLTRLTDLDLSSVAVPYLGLTQGLVAGVPALLLRIGFVGELGYELHFPAEYGDYLWTTLLDTGKDLGIAPFGVEAQRVLRLEKLHIIPGHDTDALSNPFEADLGWAVKLEKSDFIGRAALSRLDGHPLRQRLVGFEMPDGTLPFEGDAVVAGGAPVGRVTSAKRSPLLGRTIGMAWVPPELAVEGARFTVKTNARVSEGRVVLKPFHDPDGERLKS
jgi:sarcosine oxidase, subunit alpha